MSTNGGLTAAERATIPGTNRQVARPLVAQVAAFRAAFARAFGKPLIVTDGYRPYAEQEGIFRARYTTTYLRGRPSRVWAGVRWYQRPGTAQAAVPGTSNHGWGTALDLGSGVNDRDTAEWRWAVAHAPAFGFSWPSEWAKAAREWWHFEDGVVVPASRYATIPGALDIPPTGGTLPDPLTPEDDMTPEQDNLLRHIVALLAEAPGRTAAQVWAQPVSRVAGKPTTALQDLADTGTVARAVQNIVDPAALAAALAPLLTPGAVARFSDAELDRLARTVADVADERARARLAQ